jgi:hypothetical protein
MLRHLPRTLVSGSSAASKRTGEPSLQTRFSIWSAHL